MPWSGGVYTRTNGTYNGATVWASDAAASVKIQSSRHDTHDQDLAAGINACVAKDGSNTVTALNLTATVDANTGVINIGGVNFAHSKGTNSVYVGNSGNFTLTGNGNTGIGAGSLIANTSGDYNAAVGLSALGSNTTGEFNSSIGVDALLNNTAGSYNSAIGYGAIQSVTTGSQNIGIGANVGVPSATSDGQLSIQNAIYGTGNTGTSSTVSTGNIGLYTKAPTARLHLPAGTAAANTAPLKLTAGTNLGTPENGAIEFDGSAVYITIGGVRKTFTVT